MNWDTETIGGFDLFLIAIADASVDYQKFADWFRYIVDTHNAIERSPPLRGRTRKRSI